MDLQAMGKEILQNEEVKDPWYRWAIFTGQVGQLARYHYRDNEAKAKLAGEDVIKKAPTRPAGTKADERMKLGETFLQLAIYAHARGLGDDINDAIEQAFEKIADKDWMDTREGEKPDPVVGCEGKAGGRIWWVTVNANPPTVVGHLIAFLDTTEPDIVNLVISQENVKGIVCRKGGKASHPAIVARELEKPCIMNVGNLMDQYSTSEYVEMVAEAGNISISKRG